MHASFRRQATAWLIAFAMAFALQWEASGQSLSLAPPKPTGTIRLATFNVSMNRSGPGRLTEDLLQGDPQIKAIAAVIRSVQPDIILLNEIDYSTQADNTQLFEEKFLRDEVLDLLGNGPYAFPYHFSAPVNTGEPSGLDLNQNQRTDDPEDAWGFGRFPGQYGMAVLSRFEINTQATRTFQKLLWAQFPSATRPIIPGSNQPYYDDNTWKQLRLPSKSLWDVVIKVDGRPLHVIASHPTPPAFDGPEDRNGCRNRDEVQLLVDYVSSTTPESSFWVDDQGRAGKISEQAKFVIAGDLNSDPVDGDNRGDSIRQLLGHNRVQSAQIPSSEGAVAAAKGQAQKNAEHRGDAAFDTGDFNDQVVGNLRIDYVLPSIGMNIKASGIVWPKVEIDDPLEEKKKMINASSDHHLVWIDVEF